ncbi:glycoside hydrolase family 16 protein [Backusella circina FSU 941]|nr:glycoside hydrolase family 16 protein [Backusella circina FSU 941]
MYIPKLSLYVVGVLGAAQTLMTSVSAKSSSGSGECTPFFTDFTKGEADGWTEITGKGGYDFGSNGLELSVNKPKQFVRMTNSSENDLPYNKYPSPTNPNFVYKDKIQYGKVSFVVKAAPGAGVVTAPILITDGGDEIDFEMLGANPNNVQTNYFYGDKPVYKTNGDDTEIGKTTDEFRTYTIDWTEDSIVWSVDGNEIRTKDKSGDDFPYHPLEIQVGVWDASTPADTAEWAGGPIDWDEASKYSAYVKSVKVECPN